MSLKNLNETVIQNDYCIGCGVCAVVAPEAIQIHVTESGFYKAQVNPNIEIGEVANKPVEEVCPFSELTQDEDQVANNVLPPESHNHDRIGKYINCFAGKVSQFKQYEKSSSGGLGKWVLKKLLEDGHIDFVAQVYETPANDHNNRLFDYKITNTIKGVEEGSKSAYYPVELSQVLQKIRSTPGRYAITGVPCFIKAIRNLCKYDAILRERIVFTVGVVCGHLKSKFYAEMIAWQMNVQPNNLKSIDFRVKIPGRKANEKGVRVADKTEQDAIKKTKTVQEVFGTNYGHGFFKYKACDYCDDVLAETADVSVGDAWLPEYLHEGTSLLIVRNKIIGKIIENGYKSGEIILDELSADKAAKSQEGGLRHRREGLSYRLFLTQKSQKWYPPKRVAVKKNHLSWRYRRIFWIRIDLAKKSTELFLTAKKENTLEKFISPMKRKTEYYDLNYGKPLRRSVRLVLYMLRIDYKRFIK
ncbi:MAG: Coenzyme F420 hydrogenase/dehydrogenase, beta subunit C-terminal domain [Balneolales bacterium]